MNSNTHIALCDIAMFAHIPNLIYLAPTTKEEYLQMFKYATTQKDHPIAIRVPVQMIESGQEDTTDYSIHNKSQIVQQGNDIAIIGVSNLLPLALKTAQKYKEDTGKNITVINPKFLTGLDGHRISSFYGMTEMKVKNYGISKAFHTDFNADELLAQHGISVDQLVTYMKNS